MKIRAHHLLCVQGFQGKGYDRRFTEHMGTVADRFRAKPKESVEIVEGCDDICTFCPHMKAGGCAKGSGSEKDTRARDASVLKALGLAAGASMKAGEAARLCVDRLPSVRTRSDLCGPCEWQTDCLWVLGK
jgi:uncharacterized protein